MGRTTKVTARKRQRRMHQSRARRRTIDRGSGEGQDEIADSGPEADGGRRGGEEDTRNGAGEEADMTSSKGEAALGITHGEEEETTQVAEEDSRGTGEGSEDSDPGTRMAERVAAAVGYPWSGGRSIVFAQSK
jgi:hypothetical protein